jgi:hypothetical protein
MVWAKGLLAAAISAAGSSLAAMVMDPDHFNLSNLKHLGIVAGLSALMGVAGYLKQSPVPSSPQAVTGPTLANIQKGS